MENPKCAHPVGLYVRTLPQGADAGQDVLVAGPSQEDDARYAGKQPRVVVGLQTSVAQLVGRGYADRDAERPERYRDDRPAAGAQARIAGRGGHEQQDRHQSADEMAASDGAWLGLDEIVVDQMRREYGDTDHDDGTFAAWSAPVTTG
jgi:hypothetical protein